MRKMSNLASPYIAYVRNGLSLNYAQTVGRPDQQPVISANHYKFLPAKSVSQADS